MKTKQICQEGIADMPLVNFFYLLRELAETRRERFIITQAQKALCFEFFPNFACGVKVKDLLVITPKRVRIELEINGRRESYGRLTHKFLSDTFLRFGFSLGSYPFLILSWKEAKSEDFRLPIFTLEDWLPQRDQI